MLFVVAAQNALPLVLTRSQYTALLARIAMFW